VTEVLSKNAQYGTGAGSGDGVHPNAGKTGTTEDHADAWFDGYTRDLSTAVWMGYPGGEIPMLNVHGQAVAGATFPVPMWHLYMEVAEQGKRVRDFIVPKQEPSYREFTHHYFGYLAAPSTTTTTTTTTPSVKAGPPLPREVPKPGSPVPATPAPPPVVDARAR
jgi:membrane carboxypeptidase/penicillin-binding protein